MYSRGSGGFYGFSAVAAELWKTSSNSAMVLFATVAWIISTMFDILESRLKSFPYRSCKAVASQQLIMHNRLYVLLCDSTELLVHSFSWIVLIGMSYTFVSVITTLFWFTANVNNGIISWHLIGMILQHIFHTVTLVMVPNRIHDKVMAKVNNLMLYKTANVNRFLKVSAVLRFLRRVDCIDPALKRQVNYKAAPSLNVRLLKRE